MISIPRSWARDLRAVFRRLCPSRSNSLLTVELAVHNNVLTAQSVASDGAAEFRHTSEQSKATAIVPLDALADCEGKDPSPVTIDMPSEKQVEVRWIQNGVPQVRTYDLPDRKTAFPEPPTDWTRNSLELLDAVEEAVKSTADSSTRYALDHIQFKGTTGEIVASDSKQLLIQGGFTFLWQDDVLVSRIGAAAARAISRVEAAHVGRTDGYIWLRTGPWSLALPIDTSRAGTQATQKALPKVRFSESSVAVGTDANRLLGEWTAFGSYDADGKLEELKDDDPRQFVFEFTADKLFTKLGKQTLEGSYQVNLLKNPIEIDVVRRRNNKDARFPGICMIDGDQLKVCPAGTGLERPTEFKSGDGIEFAVLLKRVKK